MRRDRFELNAYRLQEYANASSIMDKKADLCLTTWYGKMQPKHQYGHRIMLDDEDIKYLQNKYAVSELKMKEIEYD